MKTTKAFTKRLKVSRNGKITSRRPGQNHFNAKEGRSAQLKKGRTQRITLSKKVLQRYITIVN